MTIYKWYAKFAGALIIIGYLTYEIPEMMIMQPIAEASDPLEAVAADLTRLMIGALIMAINSLAVVGISLFLYPVLKQHSESIALSYAGTRLFESIVLIGGVVCLLLLVPLSQEYVQADAGDAASLQALATMVIYGDFLAYHIAMVGLAVGSLPFCYLLYQSRLVPRVISILGLIGYPALLMLMVAEIFAFDIQPSLYILYVPGGLFEIGLALWLIAKGFNSSALAPKDSLSNVPEPAR